MSAKDFWDFARLIVLIALVFGLIVLVQYLDNSGLLS